MRAFAGVLVALLLLSCAEAPTSECAEFKEEVSRCLGSRVARLDCASVADADLHRLRAMMRSTSCEVLVSALPFDGNLTSATCRALNVGCVAPISPAVRRRPTKYPLLLVNGIDTSPLFRYSPRIIDALERGGQTVRLATLSPWQPTTVRAVELWQLVQKTLQETHAPRVNLICHSLGGLDCRYLVSPAGLAADLSLSESPARVVASITTVGTAHRGTRVADVMLGVVADEQHAQVIDDFATVVGDWFTPTALERDSNVRAALHSLTTTQAMAFNAAVVDDAQVYYQSFAGVSHSLGTSTSALEARVASSCQTDDSSPATAASGALDDLALTLAPLDDIVSGKAPGVAPSPHDGLVTIDSAKWGHFRGCLPADHMEQLGQYNLPDVNVKTGVDIARFYSAVAAELAERGF